MRRWRAALVRGLRRAEGGRLRQPRLAALFVREALALLAGMDPKAPALRVATISRANLHRHIVVLRFPDQPFYLDAIKGWLARRRIHLLAQQTLVFGLHCDEAGCLLELREPGEGAEENFVLAALHVSASSIEAAELKAALGAVLDGVHASVADFARVQRVLGRAARALKPHAPDDAALLSWLSEERYIVFGAISGARRYGQLRDRRLAQALMPGVAEALAELPEPEAPGLAWFVLPELGRHAYAQAPVEAFRVAWPERGRLRACVVVGHFARGARFANATRTPKLARAWRRLERTPPLQYSTFYRREVRTLFDRAPKYALLSTRAEDWLAFFRAVVDRAGPTDVVAACIDARPGRAALVVAGMAASRWDEATRARLEAELAALGLPPAWLDGYPAPPHWIAIAVVPAAPQVEAEALKAAVRRAVRRWEDEALEALTEKGGWHLPDALREIEALPSAYPKLFPPEALLEDLVLRDLALGTGRVQVRVRREGRALHVRIVSPRALALGAVVGVLRHAGLEPMREASVELARGAAKAEVADIRCAAPEAASDDAGLVQLERLLALVFNGAMDDDPLNALVLRARLDAERVEILMLLRDHLVQLHPEAAWLAITQMMLRHPEVAAALARWFTARHMPGGEAADEAAAERAFFDALGAVQTLHDDRWFRALADLVRASLRTNAFARTPEVPLAVKIAPRKLEGIPEPKPWREVFVRGVGLAGVHLRAGPIARGGIRFSDREADFRTEILELMATQVVKNGQITPTGAKGGFIVRGEKSPEAVRRQYRAFIRALLSLTDNWRRDGVVHPEGVRVHDGPDPYLVVAADKGTARFSDDANDEASRAGFWLGDAFASGGSHGYDHKKLGITAKGAWVCCAHHLQKLGLDAWRDPIRVVGIGDMSGDVFGNGMLLNPNLLLIAAFNHRWIFVDPTPNAEAAFRERKRLFEQALDWEHYDRRVISQGGGVFPRQARAIPLSAPMRKALGIEDEAETISGEALIRAILRAPVDVLYNGGIGTYVKASTETHAEVRDPANNAVRVDAKDLRCKVVVEGGNLGLTPKARIEFAARGGLVNADAVDNAAGVHISDREVNMKLLLRRASRRRRDALLERLADAVVAQCLDAQLAQARALSLGELDARRHPPRWRRLVKRLEAARLLDAFTAAGLAPEALHLRPVLATLLGQEKNRIKRALAKAAFGRTSRHRLELLSAYFPEPLARRRRLLAAHPLADAIVVTEATNHLLNHFGIAAISQLEDMTGKPPAVLAEALLVADALLDASALIRRLWEAAPTVEVAAEMASEAAEMVLAFTEEGLRLGDPARLGRVWLRRRKAELEAWIAEGAGDDAERLAWLQAWVRMGMPAEAAEALVGLKRKAEAAAALAVAATHRMRFARAMAGLARALEALPIAAIETELRSALWGEDKLLPLRRALLDRMSAIKRRAIVELAAEAGKGERWRERVEPVRARLREARDAPDDERRMTLVWAVEELALLVGD